MPRSLLKLAGASRKMFPGSMNFPEGWEALPLRRLLNSQLHQGTLIVRGPAGSELTFGDCGTPRVVVRIADYKAMLELVLNPDLAIGELYMDERLTVEEGGDVADLLDLVFINIGRRKSSRLLRFTRFVHDIVDRVRRNSKLRAKRHVAHHYDLDGKLYELFLDSDMQYSCGYFSSATQTLEQAQTAKKHHITSKLLLDRPGLTVLDVGSGWGGMAIDLARDFQASVRGITLSEEQLVRSRHRAAEAEVGEICKFELSDYRDLVGRYDRIVSVGMFEHVGRGHFDNFFVKARQLLDDEGVMVLHTIGRTDGPGITSPWMDKYVFPGGHIPALSEIIRSIERSGLIAMDIEILRLHYAKTLMEWRDRFEANRAEIARLYDERFCRMWEFYLAGSEMAFRHAGHVVFQIQLAKRIDALPLTRDYMLDIERAIETATGTEPAANEPQASQMAASRPRTPRRVA